MAVSKNNYEVQRCFQERLRDTVQFAALDIEEVHVSMGYMDEYDDDRQGSHSLPISYMVSLMAVFMLILFGVIIFLNRGSLGLVKEQQAQQSAVVTGQEAESPVSKINPLDTEKKPTADDLDFWDMYPETETDTEEEQQVETSVEKLPENDPTVDGKHTRVLSRTGKEEWVTINNYLPKNSYDLTGLVCRNNIMQYFQDGSKISYMGVDLSKYNNYVDFNDLQNAGVEFVMLRVGARGYESGTITVDDYFQENLKRATDAGLNVGLYFYSQAISTDEVKEEAKFVLDQIGEYKIKYPIAMDMEFAENDSSRIEKLSSEQKTSIAKTFCDAIKAAGYIPMIYGNKQWLIQEIQLSNLTAYDVWLSQPGDTPDYPYKFGMWQYSTSGSIDGISGNANLNISFIDYSVK